MDLTDLSRFLRAVSESAAARVLAEVKPAIEIIPEPAVELPLGASRFFGFPDLPADMPWPSWAAPDGTEQQLAFLAQINLDEVPGGRVGGFVGGWLVFFWCDQSVGLSPGDGPGHRVVYLPAGSALERRGGGRPVNDDQARQARLTFREIVTLPADTIEHFTESPDLKGTNPDTVLGAILSEFHPDPRHWLLGNPAPIQNDPLVEAEAAQMGLYDNDGGSNDAWDEAVARSAKRTLLLQIDTDESLNVMWGDVGTLYFSIGAEDLAAGRTDSTWLTFQCF